LVEALRKQGYSKVKALREGLPGWREAQLPTIEVTPPPDSAP
jgi:rhodanese-related sulfurtransferase